MWVRLEAVGESGNVGVGSQEVGQRQQGEDAVAGLDPDRLRELLSHGEAQLEPGTGPESQRGRRGEVVVIVGERLVVVAPAHGVEPLHQAARHLEVASGEHEVEPHRPDRQPMTEGSETTGHQIGHLMKTAPAAAEPTDERSHLLRGPVDG
jgi:hypothetical protein